MFTPGRSWGRWFKGLFDEKPSTNVALTVCVLIRLHENNRNRRKMMTEKVRVGVVGTSWFTETFHILPLISHPHAEVVAVCGRREDYTQEIARKHNIRQAFTDYEAMIWHGNLDAVVISAPDDLHYPITMAALDASKHVVCEKPLAPDAAQARVMVEYAKNKGVVQMINYTYRWMPHYRRMKQLIEDGYTGKPFHSHFRFHFGYGRDDGYNWRFDPSRSNGILGDLGSHMIDMARWLVGEIEWVSANLVAHIQHLGADGGKMESANDTSLLQLGFTDGSQGSILASAVSHLADQGVEQGVEIFGQGGSLLGTSHYFSSAAIAPCLMGARSMEEHFTSLPLSESLLQDLDLTSEDWIFHLFQTQPVGDRLFIDAICEGRQVTPDFTDGLRVMEVIDAAFESDRTGRRVYIPKEEDRK
jgi:predicted dehydrogenase